MVRGGFPKSNEFSWAINRRKSKKTNLPKYLPPLKNTVKDVFLVPLRAVLETWVLSFEAGMVKRVKNASTTQFSLSLLVCRKTLNMHFEDKILNQHCWWGQAANGKSYISRYSSCLSWTWVKTMNHGELESKAVFFTLESCQPYLTLKWNIAGMNSRVNALNFHVSPQRAHL